MVNGNRQIFEDSVAPGPSIHLLRLSVGLGYIDIACRVALRSAHKIVPGVYWERARQPQDREGITNDIPLRSFMKDM